MIHPLKMVLVHRYMSLPEGIWTSNSCYPIERAGEKCMYMFQLEMIRPMKHSWKKCSDLYTQVPLPCGTCLWYVDVARQYSGAGIDPWNPKISVECQLDHSLCCLNLLFSMFIPHRTTRTTGFSQLFSMVRTGHLGLGARAAAGAVWFD